jgi:hypothetical protein
VPALRRIAALLLVALWLPATLHCRVEVTLGVDCCATDGAKDATDCPDDPCGAIESSQFKSTSHALTVPAPVLCACLFDNGLVPPPVEVAAPLVVGVSEEAASPPEVRQSRHFLARSALPARAPDGVS